MHHHNWLQESEDGIELCHCEENAIFIYFVEACTFAFSMPKATLAWPLPILTLLTVFPMLSSSFPYKMQTKPFVLPSRLGRTRLSPLSFYYWSFCQLFPCKWTPLGLQASIGLSKRLRFSRVPCTMQNCWTPFFVFITLFLT